MNEETFCPDCKFFWEDEWAIGEGDGAYNCDYKNDILYEGEFKEYCESYIEGTHESYLKKKNVVEKFERRIKKEEGK